MWRSERMTYLSMIVPIEAAHGFVDEVGKRGVIQFIDLNSTQQAFQRRYIRSITTINEVQKLTDSIIGFLDCYEVPHKTDTNYIDSEPITQASLDKVFVLIRDYYGRLVTDFNVAKAVKDQLSQQQELEDVLDKAHSLISRQSSDDVHASLLRNLDSAGQNLLGDVETGRAGADAIAFRFIAGMVPKPQRPTFERQVFLASRGNAYIIFLDVESTSNEAFVVFFLGMVLEKRLTKLCHVMSINIHLHPDNEQSIPLRLKECRDRQNALRETLFKTETQLRHDLFGVSGKVGGWNRILLQSKSIFSILNLFRVNEATQMMQAEGWVPTSDRNSVQDALRAALVSKGFSSNNNPAVIHEIEKDFEHDKPPTYIKTNKFTSIYQAIVDAYGVARYGEINPGVLTIVTFPFLFGVMFGDVFHGTLLFAFALYLIVNEKKLQKGGPMNEFFAAAFDGRYILVLMGFFAIYCGLIYNDFTSLSLRFFDTRYDHETQTFNGVYPFGIDYIWYGSDLELAFLNSLKMKMAIVIGVTHMIVGVFFGLANHIHERDYLSIVCEFIPRIIFILSFFGYLVFAILRKWCMDWGTIGTHRAPSLIVTLINMVLNFGQVGSEADRSDPHPPVPLFDGQAELQATLLSLALISVPWMLLSKTGFLWAKHNIHRQGVLISNYRPLSDEPSVPNSPVQSSHHAFDLGDHFVHQMIHTIEYVLGCVSNTASYLRLWALSLAHAQLAHVFYSRLISGNYESVFSLYIGFAFFTQATFGVLLGMDVLECFLHALRLHWVEFMNKFYNADGVPFEPFFYLNLNKKE